MLGDQPYGGSSDPLGFDDTVDHLTSLILASSDSTPFTLGIEAPWGRGKSTMMGRLEARLSLVEGLETVRFNAWTADDGQVLERLVKTVLVRLDKRILRRALRNRTLVGWLRFVTSAVGGFLGFGSVVDSFWGQAIRDPQENDLREMVEEAIEAWRRKHAKGREPVICVFIDDLDRCSPAGVIEVFEAMKLYLDVPGLIFVVGYDQGIVSDLVLREKGYDTEAVKSRDYLEKFIQIVYRIPPSQPERAGAFIDSLLEVSRTGELLGQSERRLVIEGSESNPRRIKRFINRFVLAYGLEPQWQEFEPQALVRIQLLQMYFPDFARLLEGLGVGDPIEEFLEYRNARDVLRQEDRNRWQQVEGAFESAGLAAPPPHGDFEVDALARKLDDNVAVQFPALVDRRDFVALVTSLSEAGEWPRLREALALGDIPLEPVTVEAENPRWRAGANLLDGLKVLWVDDNVDANAALADLLRDEGVDLTVVPGTQQLDAALTRSQFDVIVSDIGRPGNREAGLDDAERLSREHPRLPPFVFYTERITKARTERAAALGARITTQPEELLDALYGYRRPPDSSQVVHSSFTAG